MTKTATIDKCEKLIGNDPKQAKRNRQAGKAVALLLKIWVLDPARRKGDIEALLHNQTGWQWPIKKYTPEELITKSRELGEMNTETQSPHPVGSSTWLDALERFLENHGDDFLSWRDGCIVVETYYDKQFRTMGGDTRRLISFFEDYSVMHDAARHYIAAMRQASNAGTVPPSGKKETK